MACKTQIGNALGVSVSSTWISELLWLVILTILWVLSWNEPYLLASNPLPLGPSLWDSMAPVWSRWVGQGVSDRKAFHKKTGKVTSSLCLGSMLELAGVVRSMPRAEGKHDPHDSMKNHRITVSQCHRMGKIGRNCSGIICFTLCAQPGSL